MEDNVRVKVPQKVMDGIAAIRDTGRTNMLDFNVVQVIANELELYETVVWMEEHKREWAKVLFGLTEVTDMVEEPDNLEEEEDFEEEEE